MIHPLGKEAGFAYAGSIELMVPADPGSIQERRAPISDRPSGPTAPR